MITYREAIVEDAPAIDALFRQGFIDTFGHLYHPSDLAAFFGGFTLEKWRQELADPDFAFRLAEEDGALAGYAKISSVTLPVEPAGPAVELRQLYVLKNWHGSEVARTLIDWVFSQARGRRAQEVYLSVFTENHRAKRFYERHGFEGIGPAVFMVGNQADEDILMRARL
jgi:ribosomal protein S18 acetylase RimI-like enzyme